MPWATLELDPAQANERDVKRAYAKRLKTCRPDQDPEGFRKLHEAYTTALAELQWRGEGVRLHLRPGVPVDERAPLAEIDTTPELPLPLQEQDVKPAEASPVAAAAPEISPGQRAVADAFDRLEAAIASGSPGVADLVRATEAALYENPGEVMRWGELMHDLIAKHGAHPELRLKPEAMLFELEHGGAAATLAIIERLDRQGSPQGIASLANLLLQNKQRIANPGAGIAAARLAGAAAFWVKRHSAPLADFAYEHLAKGERDFHMHMIDRHAAMAELLYSVPDRLKSFWRERIIRPPGKDAWDDEQSREALRWLETCTRPGGQTREALVGLLPEEIAATLGHTPLGPSPVEVGSSSSGGGQRVDYQHGRGTRSPAASTDNTPAWDRDTRPARPQGPRSGRQPYSPPRETGPYRTSGGRRFPFWAIGFFVAMLLKLALFSVSSSNHSSSSYESPRSNYYPLKPGETEEEFKERLHKGVELFEQFRAKRDQDRSNGAAGPPVVTPSEPGKTETPPNPLLEEFSKGISAEGDKTSR